MKNILTTLILFAVFFTAKAQYFVASIASDGTDLVVKIKPVSGDLTTNITSLSVTLRVADGQPSFMFGDVTPNTTDFPGLSIDLIPSSLGSESGYTGYLASYLNSGGTTQGTYLQDVEYELFRVVMAGNPANTVDIQISHDDFEFPNSFAINGSGGGSLLAGSLTDPGFANFFYPDQQSYMNPDGANTYFKEVQNQALPITLSTFTARAINNKDAHLKWTTESEINGSHFEIERSMDGVNFDKIATVAATGSADLGADYTYTDADVNDRTRDDVVRYYRLRMVDLDGEYKYSGIRNVNFTRELIDFNMEIYPNPTVDQVQIEMTGIDNTIAERPMLQIYDNSGALIQSRELDSDLGKIDMRDLPSKMYHFMITYKGQNYAQKIIKM